MLGISQICPGEPSFFYLHLPNTVFMLVFMSLFMNLSSKNLSLFVSSLNSAASISLFLVVRKYLSILSLVFWISSAYIYDNLANE